VETPADNETPTDNESTTDNDSTTGNDSTTNKSKGKSHRWRWQALFVILAAEVMDLVDSTIVNVGAPSIRNDIGGSYTEIQWLAAGYTLAFAVGLMTGGRLGDVFGRKRMFLLGSIGFLAASLLCSLAQDAPQLIAARVLQGLAGAILLPQGLGMMRSMFADPVERAKAFTTFGPVMGLSAVFGPIIAGGLIDLDLFGTEWRSLFWINVPLGLFAILGGIKFLPTEEHHERVKLDMIGVAIAGTAMFALVFPLVEGRELDWPLWTFLMAAASIPLFGWFAWHQLRLERAGRAPLVMPSLFRERAFNGGMVFMSSFFAAMAGLMLCFGLFVQIGLGYSPLRAGLTMVPMSVGVAIGASLSGTLANKVGRIFLHLGTTLMATGSLAIAFTLVITGSDIASWQFVPSLLLTGIGCGLVFAPFFGIVLAGVRDNEMGSASGSLNAVQQFGGALGVAVVATLFFSLVGSQAPAASQPAVDAYRDKLVAMGVPADTASSSSAMLTDCISDLATSKDPSQQPATCAPLGDPATADVAGRAVTVGIAESFTHAMERTMWLPAGLAVVACAVALLLPRKPREESWD
jgi:EmrB/QacA subfamily drug resistance transporter